MKKLFLYGPPASGKSTLARRLALEYGREAVDLDEVIVRRTGRSISDFFAADHNSIFFGVNAVANLSNRTVDLNSAGSYHFFCFSS